jgi:homoserine dehydrogenase
VSEAATKKRSEMKRHRLGFTGFGNVGRALVRLLVAKSAELRDGYGIEWEIGGVATRRLGWRATEDAIAAAALLAGNDQTPVHDNINDWLARAKPDVVFETTSLNPETGQPAIDYMRASLQAGAHVITANKAPLVYAYDELNEIAIAQGKRFMFEATVLDSAPVFSLFRETLPAAKVRAISGAFNSTTNIILETMEAGRSFAEGVKTAQELGVAETDPSHDVDGWDSVMKICILAQVILKTPLKPNAVRREGIRNLDHLTVQAARAEGKPYKLITRATMNADGSVTASVRPEQIATTEPLGNVRGTSLAIHFELDTIPGLTIVSHRPNLQSTAYGLLSDFINAVK